jgi:hypothetical protein
MNKEQKLRMLIDLDSMLIDLDIAAVRRFLPTMPDGTPMSDEGLLAGMHKARLHMPAIPRELRQQSLDWLRKNNFRDITGGPLPAELPE